VTKTVRLSVFENYAAGQPWALFEAGDPVTVWCAKGYHVKSGGYDWVYPDWQEVTGSSPASKSGREGWTFKVEIYWRSGNYYETGGQRMGTLFAVCQS
jgi:hypothetical protein